MQAITIERAVQMRTLAAELRQAAASTTMREYREKFEQTARELEDHAQELEHKQRLDS